MVLCAAAAPRAALPQVGVTTDIITGTVTGPDGRPLPGAIVEAISVETRLSRQRTTDARGRYKIRFPDGGGRYQLVVRFIGMAPAGLTVAREADQDRLVANVRMDPVAVTLDPVRATLNAKSSRDGSVSRGGAAGARGTVPADFGARVAQILPNPISAILRRRDSLRLSTDQVDRLRKIADSLDMQTRPVTDSLQAEVQRAGDHPDRALLYVQLQPKMAQGRAYMRDALERARRSLTPYQWASLSDSLRGPGGRQPERAQQQPGTVREPGSRTWSLYTSLSHVFDTNIDHAPAGLDSYGFLAGLGGQYRHRSSGSTVELAYDGVLRHYLNGDTWNRPGHEASLSVGQRIAPHWAVGAAGDLSINGSTEERVLRNEYSAGPELEYRLNRSNRLSLYGEYQLRRYPNPQGQNAVNQRVGVLFRQLLGERRGWDVSGRYEFNHADSSRQRYIVWTVGANIANPLGPDGQISASFRYRIKRYTSRLVHVGDADVLRQDHDLVATIMWERTLDRFWEMVISYTYETYESNDARREFRDHFIGLTTKFRCF